ncbi:hypothetical protein MLD38_005980 [Melastoma candidum]|nr:hypothetical protein MLD38_005980 [Melastoma candidum]
MGLAGTVDVDALTELPLLRYLSMKKNNFEGPLPKINKLRELKLLTLSDNKFGGEILDDAFGGMRGLRMVYLDGNGFTGHIPRSLTTLPNLSNLSLAGNQLDGKIPEFRQRNLHMVNLANNHFEGSIPHSLATMNSSYFAGMPRVFELHHLQSFKLSIPLHFIASRDYCCSEVESMLVTTKGEQGITGCAENLFSHASPRRNDTCCTLPSELEHRWLRC